MQSFTNLVYHRILTEPDPLTQGVTIEQFKNHLRILAKHYTVLPLSVAFHRLQEETLPKGVVCISFDDGYLDQFTHALPALESHGFKASFFITTSFLHEKDFFYDRVVYAIRHYHSLLNLDVRNFDCSTLEGKRAALKYALQNIKKMTLAEREQYVQRFAYPPQPRMMMHPSEVQALEAAGMHIGVHTVNHPIMSTLSLEESAKEIKQSKEYLENLVQKRLDWFAYPNGKEGDYNLEHIAQLQKFGFTGAVTTCLAKVGKNTDPFQLPRFTPWRHHSALFRLQQTRMETLEHT